MDTPNIDGMMKEVEFMFRTMEGPERLDLIAKLLYVQGILDTTKMFLRELKTDPNSAKTTATVLLVESIYVLMKYRAEADVVTDRYLKDLAEKGFRP